jgi:hypothetical protein
LKSGIFNKNKRTFRCHTAGKKGTHMTSPRTICPQCITLHAPSASVCPDCGGPLKLMSPTESPTNAGATTTGTTVNTESTKTPQTSTCPHCQGVLVSVGGTTCPLCNKPFPAWWLAWTKAQQPTSPETEGTSSGIKPPETQQTAAPPPAKKPQRQIPGHFSADHHADIIERSYNAYTLQLMLVRGIAYLASIIAGILFIVAAGSLNGMSRNSSDVLGFLSMGVFAGAFSAFIGTFFVAFVFFLLANILEMKIADTKNIVFMAKRANETQQIQAQLLQLLSRDQQR